ELHARLNEASTADNPIFDLAVRLNAATAPPAGPLGKEPLDADIVGVLRGFKDFEVRPLPVKLKEFQAAGGRFDITNARLKQADSLAVTSGTLALSASGRLDGSMIVTLANFERVIAALGGWQKLTE